MTDRPPASHFDSWEPPKLVDLAGTTAAEHGVGGLVDGVQPDQGS